MSDRPTNQIRDNANASDTAKLRADEERTEPPATQVGGGRSVSAAVALTEF